MGKPWETAVVVCPDDSLSLFFFTDLYFFSCLIYLYGPKANKKKKRNEVGLFLDCRGLSPFLRVCQSNCSVCVTLLTAGPIFLFLFFFLLGAQDLLLCRV